VSLENILKSNKMYELGMVHMLTFRKINDFYQTSLKQHGLTPVEWFMLGAIQDATPNGGIRVTDLAISFNVKTTYVTSTLNNLRTKKFVNTRFDPSDARVRLAILTSSGAKRLSEIELFMRKEIAQSFDGRLSADEFSQFMKTMYKLGHAPQK